MPSLGPVKKATMDGGRVLVSVRNILSGKCTCSVILCGRDLHIVGVNGQNTGGGPCGIPLSGDSQDG